MTRRRVLLFFGGAAAATMTGAVGLLALRGHAPSVPGLVCLSDHEYRTVRMLASALFPAGGAFPIGADEVDLARAFDAFLADEPPELRSDLKNALSLFEMGPVAFERRLVTFSNLNEAERFAHFVRWSESDELLRRQVALGLRRFMSLVFYDHPEVWPHIGYANPR